MKKIIFASFLSVAIFGCSEKGREVVVPSVDSTELSTEHAVLAKVAFAKALAKSVSDNEMRNMLVAEAVKQFDNDYDVLYFQVKNKEVKGDLIEDRIEKYLTQKEIGLIKSDKLLTIYIPEINNNLEKVKDGIPLVAVRDINDKLVAYDQNGDSRVLDDKSIPDVPIVVIKENERVVVSNKQENSLGAKKSSSFFSSEGNDFYYRDNAFDPRNKKRLVETRFLDAEVMRAYNQNISCNGCYQRDWIYYGIYPVGGQNEGTLNAKYSEALTAIAFNSPTSFFTLGGWDEGHYELHIRSFYGGRTTGAFGSDLKVLSVLPVDLFEFSSTGSPTACKQYSPGPVTYFAWDMNMYGDRIAFSVEEYDPSTTTTRKYTHTTTFGANFKANFTIVKVGTEFGGSVTDSRTNEITVTTTEGSDQLGTGVMSWKDPVITSIVKFPNPIPSLNKTYATTKVVNTGSVSLSIEPVRVMQ